MVTNSVNSARLAELRKQLAVSNNGQGVHAYIVPADDPHMSEYAPDCYARRNFISNFTGSAGTVVVTGDKKLDLNLNLVVVDDWLAEHLPEGGSVGIDPFVHTVSSVKQLKQKLEAANKHLFPLLEGGTLVDTTLVPHLKGGNLVDKAANKHLVPLLEGGNLLDKAASKHLVPLLEGGNLVDKVWATERPSAPTSPVRIHPAEWAGETVSSKLERTRKEMKAGKAEVLLVTALDESPKGAFKWSELKDKDVDAAKLPAEGSALRDKDVDTAKPPAKVMAHLKANTVGLTSQGPANTGVFKPAKANTVGLTRAKVNYTVCASMQAMADIVLRHVNYAVYAAASEAVASAGKKRSREGDAPKATKFCVEHASPVSAFKALKNDSELAGMREAHLRDAVALCETLCWLDDEVAVGKVITEVEVDMYLTSRRAAQPGFYEPSFSTIAGSGPNGAIIHYRAKAETYSGGQYDCGTTDITRTMNFGTPSERHTLAYTRVLQGHIALDTATFPEGTTGMAIDTLARMFLWKDGLNYRHGTGHGVGAALNVHEGPQSISTRVCTTGLSARMVCSNEPGYYEDGNFGVRIENLMIIKEVDTPNRFGGISYLGFERLTLVPIQTKMMDSMILSEEEIAWVDGYHTSVWEAVSPRLAGNDRVLEWLKTSTRPLVEQQSL
eukprot:gene2572-30958_t